MPVDFLQFSGGLQTTTSTFLRRPDQLIRSVNVNGDTVGALTGRLGYTQFGDTHSASQNVMGAASYNDVSGGTQYLFAIADGALKYQNGGTWTSIVSASGLLATAKAEFRVFLDQLFMVGANSTNTYLTSANIDGISYSTSTNLNNAPNARFIEIFRDRIYMADCVVATIRYPDRFYYSSLPNTAATTITWDTSSTSTQFERVYTNNGEPIMGLHTNKTLNELLIFKQTSLHAWNTSSLRDVGNVGTTSHRSIKTINYVTFFFSEGGIYAYSGQEPQLISRGIQKWINGIDQTALGDVFAEVEDNKYYRLFVGSITVDGVTYTKCEIRYSVLDNTLTIYSYANTFKAYALHKVSGKIRIYGGASDGKIYQHGEKDDTIYDDAGTAIAAEFMFETDLGLPSERKNIDKALIYSSRAQTLTGRIAVKNQDWSTHFSVDKDEQEVNLSPMDGRTLWWHFSASYSVQPFVFEGLTFVPRVTTQKYAE